MGVFRPDRPWRWAVAGFVGVAFADLLRLGSSPQMASFQPQAIWEHAQASGPHWLVVSLAILLGAYLGSKLPGSGL
jgi:hypothetical protein